jgi:hypothetical protein
MVLESGLHTEQVRWGSLESGQNFLESGGLTGQVKSGETWRIENLSGKHLDLF